MTKILCTIAPVVLLWYSFPAQARANDHERQVECLAKNAYFEARGEGRRGIVAVTNVVLNRTKRPNKFGRTPCEVVAQRHAGTCQFSWYCGDKRVRDWDLFELCKKIVGVVYSDRPRDPTMGATYYHASSVGGGWFKRNLTMTIKIGGHIFYK